MTGIATIPFEGSDEQWNASIAEFPLTHPLQTAEWASLKKAYGWSPSKLFTHRDGAAAGAALTLTRRIPILRRSLVYVPKGPLAATGDADAWRSLADSLHTFGKMQRAIFVKIDPDLTSDDTAALGVLEEAGFRRSSDQVQYRKTFVIDLTADETKLRANMRKEAKYYLNVAQRHGVSVVEGGAGDLDEFLAMYRHTARRNGFLLRPDGYYKLNWRSFLEAGNATLFIAKVDGESVAAVIVYHLGKRVWYMYGASTDLHRTARPNHWLQWHVIRWAKAKGFDTYDLWGAPNVQAPDEPLAGVAQFKKSLGGGLIEWAGAYDLVLDRRLYALWTRWMPATLALGRRLLRLPDATLSEG